MNTIEYLKKQISILLNLYNTNKYDDVIAKTKVLLKKYNNQIILYNLLSLSLSGKGDRLEAIKVLEKALKIESNNIYVINNLGLLYFKLNDYSKAEIYLDRALTINPNFYDALINYGNLLLNKNENKKAIDIYLKAADCSQNNLGKENALMLTGNAMQQAGEFDKASKIYREVLKINKHNTNADKAISVAHKYENHDDDHLISMEKKIKEIDNQNSLKSLYFAIGKAYEDLNDVERSFKYIVMANNIEKKNINYNINDDIRVFKKIKKIFSDNTSQDFKIKIPEKKIIFIVGMPRSGTTLVEQIISSHKEVYGAGELPYLSQFFNKKFIEEDFLTKNKKSIFEEVLNECQNDYFKKLQSLNVDEKIIVDKAPLNFRWIGFIVNAFPGAKIINCSRDPMAICWSNYKNSFSSKSIGFSYDLDDLGNYYKLYNELILFWKSLFPKTIFDLDYQDLINDKNKQIKTIIEHCELSWDENCLFPEKNKKSVSTASISQVRSPIYNSSLKNWQKYSEKLEKLIKIIN